MEISGLELFKITLDDIVSTAKITPEDITLVLDKKTKNIYVYRGRYSLPIDDFQAAVLYERIINRFLNPNIYLIKTLVEKEDDTPELIKIKEFIVDSYPNLSKFELKRTLENIFLLKGVRERIKAFKNYENSREWRSKLSNTTNLWRLSVFNVFALFSVGLILILKILLDLNQGDFFFLNSDKTYNTSLWTLWLENLVLTIALCAFILAITFIVNLAFILFPLKFPIKPNSIHFLSGEKDSLWLKQKGKSLDKPMPPTPKMPVLPPTDSESSIGDKVKAGTPIPKMNIDLTKKSADFARTGKSEKLADGEEFGMDEDFDIPAVPLKKKLTPKVSGMKLDIADADKLKNMDTPNTKHIVIDCPICNKNLIMPIPRKIVNEAKEPVVEFSYVHGKPSHVLVAQIDHDYDVRRRRASWVAFEESAKN